MPNTASFSTFYLQFRALFSHPHPTHYQALYRAGHTKLPQMMATFNVLLRPHHHFVIYLLFFLVSISNAVPTGRDVKELNWLHEEMRLGSSPPSCRYKCGRCYPCKAVNVPIQPGMSVPLEYYPEAWRCKCGNKLYMP